MHQRSPLNIILIKVEFVPDRIRQTEMAFKQLDMNKDGFITREEFQKVLLRDH